MNHILTKSMKSQQFKLLSSNLGLYQLFNKLEMKRVFTIPENSLVVNLDNITFGPEKYSIMITQLTDVYYKVLYYCVLYFAFEKNRENKGYRIYQKLLQFILKNKTEFHHPKLQLSEQQVKIFSFKFLNILASAQNKKKIVFEEINSLPQISLVLIDLFKSICDYDDINIEHNARWIQENLLQRLGIKIELLSYEMFIIEDEFVVEMRQFQDYFQFTLVTQKTQDVERRRNEFFLAQSACFNLQISNSMTTSNLKVGRQSNIIKKSTLKSVMWMQDQEAEDSFAEDECKNNHIESQDLMNNNTLTSINSQKMNLYKKKNSKEIDSTQDDFDNTMKRLDRAMNMRQIISSQIKNSSLMYFSDKFYETAPESTENAFKFIEEKTIKCQSLQYKNPFMTKEQFYELKGSYSTKCIKHEKTLQKSSISNRTSRRVPKFILQKMSEKKNQQRQNVNEKMSRSVHEINLGGNGPYQMQKKTIKITFSYLS